MRLLWIPSTTRGQNTIVFTPNNGNDVIYDFHHDLDHIELDEFFKTSALAAHFPTKAGNICPASSERTSGGYEILHRMAWLLNLLESLDQPVPPAG